MSTEFNFLVMDANQRVEAQQEVVRQLVRERIDLAHYKRRNPLPLPPARTTKPEPVFEDDPAE
jgi:hypothetical protein